MSSISNLTCRICHFIFLSLMEILFDALRHNVRLYNNLKHSKFHAHIVKYKKS